MQFTSTIILGLATLASASTPRAKHAVDVLSYLPDQALWRATDAIIVNHSLTHTLPVIGGDVTACSSVEYDEVSPARTSVVRDDCADLAEQVNTTPGFWELYNWSHDDRGKFEPLISNGTCEFAVMRRDALGGFNATISDVVIIGNHDVYKILNASVYDYAALADETFIDAERNQGHMSCEWCLAVNASMAFRIQKTGTR